MFTEITKPTASSIGVRAERWSLRAVLTRYQTHRKERADRRAKLRKALRQYDELLRMPNHMLADIGLTRDMVRQERTRVFYTGIVDHSEVLRPR